MKRRRLRDAAVNLALLLASLAVCLIVGEVAFRSVFDIGFAERPLWYSLNSMNFRGNEPQPKPAPGTSRRIVLLGDSYAFGFGVREADTLPRLLPDALRRRNQPGTEVISMAQMGWNTRHEVDTYRQMAARFDHDVVVLAHTFNDIEAEPILVTHPRAFLAFTQFTALHHLVYLGWRVRQDAAVDGHDYQQTLAHWYTGRQAPEWQRMRESLVELAQLCRQGGKRLVILEFEVVAQGDDTSLRAVVRREMAVLAKELNVDFVQLPPVSASSIASYRVHTFDTHPNAAAQRLAADVLAETLSTPAPGDLR